MTDAAPPKPTSQAVSLDILETVLRTAPIILWAADTAGTYTYGAGHGLEVAGIELASKLGHNVFHPNEVNAATSEAMARALAGEQTRTTTNPKPGVYFENWYIPLRRDGDGEVCGVVGIAMDASERVMGELALQEKLSLIERQSATIRSLATPIIQVWDEVLCLPIIGIVDSARTAEMMQELLSSIVREDARYAIIDLTGVELVDTATADHLIQLFRAAKVLGVEGILCGIRPAVAQTVVALGLELSTVRTMRSLRDALRWCIRAREARRPVASVTTTKAAPPSGEGAR